MKILRPALLILVLFTAAVSAEPDFVHCFDFGCKSTREIDYSERHWRQVRAVFDGGIHDREEEKQAIRRAIALMESISGELAGTHLDKAGNYPGYDLARQMDCIDESTNTYQYLHALERLQLLKWHRVDLKQRRIVWFLTHWTATITEIDSGKRFAVDSWYRDNGELPYIQPIEDWQKKRDWPAAFNPELKAG